MLAHLKIPWATIFKIPLRQYIRVVASGLKPRWCIVEAIFWKLWPWAFFATVTFVCVLAVREWFYMVLKQKNCEKIIMALATNPPPMGKSHEKFPFLGTSPFFSSISSVLSTHKDSFTVQWVEWVALTKSHSNILHTLLCICKREKWDLRSSCFNFFVDFFYLVFILWSYLIRKVVSKYFLFVFLKDLPPKLLKAADYILQGPQHGSTAVLPPHKTSQNKKKDKNTYYLINIKQKQ